jgi:hypothetical protein
LPVLAAIIDYNPSLIIHLLFILEVLASPSDPISETEFWAEQSPRLAINSSPERSGIKLMGQTDLGDPRCCNPKRTLPRKGMDNRDMRQ